MSWSINEARQHFAEIIRHAAEEPQLIYSGDQLVAAMIDAEAFNAFKQWQASHQRKTLAEELAELREIAVEENYELVLPLRTNRPNAFIRTLEESEEGRSE